VLNLPRLHLYIAATLVAREAVAFTSLLEKLRSAGVDVVDYDELMRRVVVRASGTGIALLASFAKAYFEDVSFEIKASARPGASWRPPRAAASSSLAGASCSTVHAMTGLSGARSVVAGSS
jgi:hypothetical protein